MMLLNNDYYLDMKNDILSKDLSSVINTANDLIRKLENHVTNNDMHYHDGVNVSYVTNDNYVFNNNLSVGSSKYSDKMSENTIKYIPINWNAYKIQDVIDNIPHDLNGFTLILLFVIPEEYKTNNMDYVIDLGNESITINNFTNGNILIMGDWLHKNSAFKIFQNVIRYKNNNQINDPVRNDNFNINEFIAMNDFHNEKPESIDSIISYESNRNSIANEYKNENTYLKKIIIKGTGFNNNYSVLSLIDNTANIQIKNISFESSVKELKYFPNVLDVDSIKNLELPEREHFLLMYPFTNSFEPEVNDIFKNIVMEDEFIAALNSLNNYEKNIENVLYSITENKDLEKRSIIEKLTFIEDELNSDATILGAEKMSTSEFDYNDVINDLKIKVKELKDIITYDIKEHVPNSSFSYYQNKFDGSFSTSSLKANVSNYIGKIGYFIGRESNMLNSVNFLRFIEIRQDLVPIDSENFILSESSSDLDKNREIFINTYFKEDIDIIKNNIADLNINVIGNIENKVDEFDKKLFEFKPLNGIGFKLENVNKNSKYESLLKFDNYASSYKSLYFDNGKSNNLLKYLKFENKNSSKFIGNVLFRNQKFSLLEDNKLSGFESSNSNTTICFWSKTLFDESLFSNLAFIGFKIKGDDSCFLKIGPHGIKTFNKNGDFKERVFFAGDIICKKFNNEWLFWEIKIDLSKQIDNLIGLKCAVYHLEDDNGKPKVVKNPLAGTAKDETYNLNINENSPDNAYDLYINMDPRFSDEHSFNEIIDNLEIYIGYSEEFIPGRSLNKQYFNGYMRNFMILAGHLNNIQIESLVFEGLQSLYGTKNKNDSFLNSKLFENKKFFTGLIGSYNNTNINILNCTMKFNGKTYDIEGNK